MTKKQLPIFRTIPVCNRLHVMRDLERNLSMSERHIGHPNYQGEQQALCGVLKEGETLETWIKRNKKHYIN